MCGRTFCAIDPICLQKSCQYVDPSTGQYACPEWIDAPTGESFKPLYNIGPTIFTPVLLSAAHHLPEQANKRVVQPMRWGLIPQWHKGDRKEFKTMHNNCRGETISEKSTFSVPFVKGKRCVVIAEGFYEWKKVGTKKTPYLFTKKESCTKDSQYEKGITDHIKNEQLAKLEPSMENTDSHKKMANSQATNLESIKEEHGSSIVKPLLFMAGIFDICKEQGGSLYSYCIITTQAVGKVSEIHHRMPVILESDEDIAKWLNFQEFPCAKVKDLITGRDCLQSHQVTDKVNNVRYQEADCHLPVTELSGSSSKLTKGDLRNWFAKAEPPTMKSGSVKRKSEPNSGESIDFKVVKKE